MQVDSLENGEGKFVYENVSCSTDANNATFYAQVHDTFPRDIQPQLRALHCGGRRRNLPT